MQLPTYLPPYFSLTLSLNVTPPTPIICGLLCCFSPPHLQMLSLDVSVKWKWVDKRERGIFSAFIVPLKSLLMQHSACKAYSWKTIIKGVNRERNYMWCRHWAKTANACPTSKQRVLTRCGSQNLGRHSNFYGKKTILLKLLAIPPKDAAIKKSDGGNFVRRRKCVGTCVWKRQRDRREMRLDHRDLLHGRGILISIKTGPAHSSRELKTLIVLSAFLSLSHRRLCFILLAFVCACPLLSA